MRSIPPAPRRTTFPGRRAAHGFTLVEVLVSIGLGLMVLTALTALFANHSRHNGERESTSRQLESGRYALDTLATDLRHAGFYGEFDPQAAGAIYQDPAPCATAPADLGWNTVPLTPNVPAAVRGIPATAIHGCLLERLAGTEAVTVRRASTGSEQTMAGIVPGNLYLQVSRCGDDVQQLAVGADSTALTLRNITCTGVIDSVRRYVARTYYIARCNDCAGNDGIPTLKRVELVNGVLRTTAIAEGIENLQIEYGIDTDAGPDGRPDEFVVAAAVNGVPATRVWPRVVAARVHLLSRNTEPSAGYRDPRTYLMGAVTVTPANVSAAAASYKRTLMTETVRLFNVGDRFE